MYSKMRTVSVIPVSLMT